MHVVCNSHSLVLISFVPFMVSQLRRSVRGLSVSIVYVVDRSFVVGMAVANFTPVLPSILSRLK